MLKFGLTALTALSLAVTPAAATVQAAPVEPASERVEGEQIRGGFLLPLAIIVAIILGILLLTRDDDEDAPISP